MPGDSRITPDDSRLTDQRSRDDELHPIGDVLAELLDQYGIKFPDIHVAAVGELPGAK